MPERAGRKAMTAGLRRSTVIARYALTSLLDSRLFMAFLIACLVPSFVGLVGVHLRYNVAAIEQASAAVDVVLDLDAWIFETVMNMARGVTFLVVLIAGPGLVSPDRANNAMPLYFSRPVAKLDYILGKLLVLLGLSVAVGLAPGLAVVAASAIYAGEAWGSGARLALAFTTAILVWTLCLSLLALAISAWVKWRPAATLGLLGLYVMASSVGAALEPIFGGASGSLLDLGDAVQAIAAVLSGVGEPAVPFTFAWSMVGVIAALAAAALALRVRA